MVTAAWERMFGLAMFGIAANNENETSNLVFCQRRLTLMSGEPSRARTCDPLIKSQLLYQLSYRPTAK